MKRRILSALLSMVLLVTVFSGLLASTSVSVSAANIMGDMNKDGDMTTSDAYLHLRDLVIRKGAPTSEQAAIADLNGDGAHSTTDVRMILQQVVNKEDKQPIRAFWLTYYEVESLYTSGNPDTVRAKIDSTFDDMLSRGTNTIYYHVRANSDAYYDSAVFNSYKGTATLVSKGFDPFEYAVLAAHKRGMRIEAWFNPYRIGSDKSRAKVSDYFQKDSAYYYIPSSEAVKDLTVRGVKEVVDRYEIDGVHFDDYFYPTGKMSTSVESFETADYNAYKNAGGTLSIGDWRRMHVDDLVQRVYAVAHTREGCVFGISPAGDYEKTYSKMYGNVQRWMKYPGYIDYVAPQLYFGFNNAAAPYVRTLYNWEDLPRHNSLSMIVGLAFYKTGMKNDTNAGASGQYEWANNNNIMKRQVNEAKYVGWQGAAFFSYGSLTDFTDRNSTVAKADMASGCSEWMVFN